jgi:hypothetical protein
MHCDQKFILVLRAVRQEITVCCADGSVNNEDLTRGNVVGSFVFPNNINFTMLTYDSIICFEDVKVRYGFRRKSVFEGTNCRAHFLLSIVIENDTFLCKCDFPGKKCLQL